MKGSEIMRDELNQLSQNETLDSKENALEEFLLDIECLAPLGKWTSTINIFDILKISKAEIRHSNILAWLLNANESHGLSDGIIKDMLQTLIVNNKRIFAIKEIGIIQVALIDYFSFNVLREFNNIDILMVSEKEKIAICIENKVDTVEHDNQLEHYKEYMLTHYKEWKTIFIYLTPTGIDSSDTQNWIPLSYETVLEIIQKNIYKATNIQPVAHLIISNYIDTIRRSIVNDKELQQVSSEIYKKHKIALDLIFDNRPDEAYNMYEKLMNYIKNRAEHNKDIIPYLAVSSKGSVFFTTPFIENEFPGNSERQGWKTAEIYSIG